MKKERYPYLLLTTEKLLMGPFLTELTVGNPHQLIRYKPEGELTQLLPKKVARMKNLRMRAIALRLFERPVMTKPFLVM